jgi:glutamyl-tRNA synthetase
MTVITRFAPSPTGMLHIGGARTALFNYLFAKHHGGQFKLRIEDTDKARSTPQATQALLDGLKWLNLDWDGEAIFQSAREARHAEVAHELVAQGKAYYCYTTAEELAEQRKAAEAKGEQFKYDRKWRDGGAAPEGVKPSIRIKAPLDGEVIVRDTVQGDVRFAATELDDFVILRSDGSPTYMHAVVVDDHDMGVTHIIRGDDHLNNAGRQLVIYQAMGWAVPQFAHIPLIHDADGKKLSKRKGAASTTEYAEMGYLPEAMRNYLVRLGWAHGDDEIFSDEQAIEWFSLEAIGQSPARLDFAKLNHVNAHYLRLRSNTELAAMIAPKLSATPAQIDLLERAMDGLKPRAQTLIELAEAAKFYLTPRPIQPDEKAAATLAKFGANLPLVIDALTNLEPWNAESIKASLTDAANAAAKKLGELMPPMRAAIVGAMSGPDIPDAMAVLGREESLARLRDAAK